VSSFTTSDPACPTGHLVHSYGTDSGADMYDPAGQHPNFAPLLP
jgi:hypothetical protein